MLFKTLILTNCDLVASAIARAAIPSFLRTFIPTLISLSIDKFSTTPTKVWRTGGWYFLAGTSTSLVFMMLPLSFETYF